MTSFLSVLRHMWQCSGCGAWIVADQNPGKCGAC